MLGAGQKATNNVIDGISARVRTGQIQTENVRKFVETGDFAHLADKPQLHIPFPSAERLRDLLAEPKLRAILPPALTGAPERRARTAILTHGPMLLPLGLALLMLAGLACLRSRRQPSADPPQSLCILVPALHVPFGRERHRLRRLLVERADGARGRADDQRVRRETPCPR